MSFCVVIVPGHMSSPKRNHQAMVYTPPVPGLGKPSSLGPGYSRVPCRAIDLTHCRALDIVIHLFLKLMNCSPKNKNKIMRSPIGLAVVPMSIKANFTDFPVLPPIEYLWS